LIANGKHRKKNVFQLEQDEGTIVGEESFNFYITEYYNKLFGDLSPPGFTMFEDIIPDIPQLTTEQNDILTSSFTEKDIHDAIFEMD
jgi:hypothetical protein